MRIPTIVFLACLAACAVTTTPREGKPVPVNAPQAAEQCKVQSWLDWCPK